MPNYTDSEIAAFTTALQGNNVDVKRMILQGIPISPPNGGVTNASYHKPLPGSGSTGRLGDFTKLKVTQAGYRIAYLDLMRSTDPAKVGALTFDAHFADQCPVPSRAARVPIWWLPWESRQMTKIKIDPTGGNLQDAAGNALPNPDLFFTAALSGCSVFVRGAPTAPRIYHGGITGKLVDQKGSHGVVRGVFNAKEFKRLGKTAPGFWRNVLDGMNYHPSGDVKKMTVGTHQKTGVSEVNLTHYVSDKGTATTVNSRNLEKFLKKHSTRNNMQVQAVIPWGSVVGLRDTAGNWSFYMQQNVTVIYQKTGMGVTTDCLLLSFTRFFPGVGQVSPPRLGNGDFERISHLLR